MILTNTNQFILACEKKTTERAVCAFAAGYIIKILEERQIYYLCILHKYCTHFLEHMESPSNLSVKMTFYSHDPCV